MKTRKFTFGRNNKEVSVTAKGDDRIDLAQRIYDAANDEGTIQAWDMVNIDSDPRHHTTCSMSQAFAWAGFIVSEENE